GGCSTHDPGAARDQDDDTGTQTQQPGHPGGDGHDVRDALQADVGRERPGHESEQPRHEAGGGGDGVVLPQDEALQEVEQPGGDQAADQGGDDPAGGDRGDDRPVDDGPPGGGDARPHDAADDGVRRRDRGA